MNRLRPIAFLLLALALTAGARKQPAMSVRFHLEANSKDSDTFSSPVTMLATMRPAYVEKLPAISERDVLAIYPFEAADGSMGCAFKLDSHGTIALDSLSVERRGGYLLAFISGRQVVDLQIDKRIPDGIITIPNGLTLPEIEMLKRYFHVLGTGKQAAPTPVENPQALKADRPPGP